MRGTTTIWRGRVLRSREWSVGWRSTLFRLSKEKRNTENTERSAEGTEKRDLMARVPQCPSGRDSRRLSEPWTTKKWQQGCRSPKFNGEACRRRRRKRAVLPIGSSVTEVGGRSGSSEGWRRRCREGGVVRLQRSTLARARRAGEACEATGRPRAGPSRGV